MSLHISWSAQISICKIFDLQNFLKEFKSPGLISICIVFALQFFDLQRFCSAQCLISMDFDLLWFRLDLEWTWFEIQGSAFGGFGRFEVQFRRTILRFGPKVQQTFWTFKLWYFLKITLLPWEQTRNIYFEFILTHFWPSFQLKVHNIGLGWATYIVIWVKPLKTHGPKAKFLIQPYLLGFEVRYWRFEVWVWILKLGLIIEGLGGLRFGNFWFVPSLIWMYRYFDMQINFWSATYIFIYAYFDLHNPFQSSNIWIYELYFNL